MAETSFTKSSWEKKDINLETTLRPASLNEFNGQDSTIEKLAVFVGAAKQRNESLGHTLFYGPPGLGKTTLGYILAGEMNSDITITSGPSLDKPADLAGILTNLKDGDILFIDEIHRLNKNIEEYLYTAMEDFKLDLMLDSGPQARSVQVDLCAFTLVGATTRMGQLSAPFRSRFRMTCRLDYYSSDYIITILERSSRILKLSTCNSSLSEVAKRSRGTPRIANNLLKWVRDYSQMRSESKLDRITTRTALEMLDIDFKGLDEMDKRILNHIIEHHKGGPVGLSTIAIAIGEDATTLEEVNEPYLIMQGFLKRTPRGREATEQAYKHLGKPIPNYKENGADKK